MPASANRAAFHTSEKSPRASEKRCGTTILTSERAVSMTSIARVLARMAAKGQGAMGIGQDDAAVRNAAYAASSSGPITPARLRPPAPTASNDPLAVHGSDIAM